MGLISRRSLITAATAAAAKAQDTTFRVDVKLVRMLATVKNAQGQLVGGLNKDEFTITDNDVPQEVALFERNTSQPLSIAMLVDTSRSTEREKRYELGAVRKFMKALVREGNPGDTLGLYSFNYQVTMEANFTRNMDRLDAALGRLKSEGATALYDAIYLAGDDLEHREGRRVVVVVSDGGDTISKVRFEKALEALHRANAVIYAVLLVPVAGDAWPQYARRKRTYHPHQLDRRQDLLPHPRRGARRGLPADSPRSPHAVPHRLLPAQHRSH
ncbi:MAG: VWA domain-containing protein [Bryobacterales bacterium]|nr:VWA domain-containing protein [Bryobacterales bacterium]